MEQRIIAELPVWAWLAPVWITAIICGTICFLRYLKHDREESQDILDWLKERWKEEDEENEQEAT